MLLAPAQTTATGVRAFVAGISLFVRNGMLDVLHQDYITTARAKGLPERVVIYKHALRNALVPIITLGALEFGTLLSGAVLTEQVFSTLKVNVENEERLHSGNPVMGDVVWANWAPTSQVVLTQ